MECQKSAGYAAGEIPAPLEEGIIAEHVRTYHSSSIQVADTLYKGRVLLAATDCEAGEQVLLEYPLIEVCIEPSAPACQLVKRLHEEGSLALPPLFYWAALHSLTSQDVNGAVCKSWPTVSAQTQAQALELQGEATEPSQSICTLASALWPEGMGPDLLRLEQLLQVWIYNSFDQGGNDDSLEAGVIFLAASMCSHSCSPNAAWHLNDENHWNLYARVFIEEDQELTIPYLGLAELCLPTPDRREILKSTKDFVCQCERCAMRLDDARSFRCPRCRGSALATAAATGTETASDIECGACGKLTADEATPLLAEEARLRPWARSRPEFHDATTCEESGEGSVLDWLQRADDAGLGLGHWIVDALRAAAMEVVDVQAQCELLRQRVAAHDGVPHAITKCARLQLALGEALYKSGSSQEAAGAFRKAAETLALLFGDGHPEHHEATQKAEKAEAKCRSATKLELQGEDPPKARSGLKEVAGRRKKR